MNNKDKILALLSERPYSANSLSGQLQITTQALHRHLLQLVSDKKIIKQGSAPKTVYVIAHGYIASAVLASYRVFNNDLLPKYLVTNHSLNKPKALKDSLDLNFLLTKSALYSSKIEGNTLDLNSLMNHRGVARGKEYIEVEDLLKAYLWAQNVKLSEEGILKAHRKMSKSFMSNARQGVYRKERVGVFDAQGLIYLAVEEKHVIDEMTQLVKILCNLCSKNMSFKEAVFWAQWAHLMFVLIHPFADGNGRAGRLLEKWFLAEKYGSDMWYLETEFFYFNNRKEYYESLQLGPNYWEVDYYRSDVFMSLLPKLFVSVTPKGDTSIL